MRVTKPAKIPPSPAYFLGGLLGMSITPLDAQPYAAGGWARSGFARRDSINFVTYSGDFVLRATSA